MKMQMRSVLRALDAVLRGDLRARDFFVHGASIASSRVTRALRERCGPGVHISLSHEVVGTFREFERAATTEVDAALCNGCGACAKACPVEAAASSPAMLRTMATCTSAGRLVERPLT